MSVDELGDPARLHIGKNGSLYRVCSYVGMFHDGHRHGYGIAIFSNGDQLIGEFVHGKPVGLVVCKYRASGRSKLALFDANGVRTRWIEGTSADREILSKYKLETVLSFTKEEGY